jgi:RNA polymerase-interacting CarD/CdnL/TRCF family regulator
LADIVGSMSELKETKRFQASDRQTLERAKRMLACEISAVTGETQIAAEEQIDRILEERKGLRGGSSADAVSAHP